MDSLPLIYMQTKISVLIPLYNENPADLVNSLLKQLSADNVDYEILIGDDSIQALEDKILKKWNDQTVKYFHNKESLGRSANRNMLAGRAAYNYLLFLDCDGIIPDKMFVSRYLKVLDGESAFCGGTLYQNSKPDKKEQILRWTYGREREVISSENRNNNPYNSFSSFNFCIPTKLFKEVLFDEDIKEYGHEDSLFGFDLKESGIPVKHLDNPMIHNGLESAIVFISKTEKAVKGLCDISKRDKIPAGFLDSNTLWRAFEKAKKSGLDKILSLFFPFIKMLVFTSILSRNPKLYLFDIYKLAYLSKIQG